MSDQISDTLNMLDTLLQRMYSGRDRANQLSGILLNSKGL